MSDPIRFAGQIIAVAEIGVLVLGFDPLADDTFSLTKSVLGQVLSYFLVVTLALLVLRDRKASIRWSPLHIAVALVLASFVLSALLAQDHYVAVFGAPRRYLGLLQLVNMAALYVAGVILFRHPRDYRFAFGAVCALTLGLLGYAWIQQLGLDPIGYSFGTTVPGVNIQPISTVGQPDVLGGLLGIGVVVFAAAALLHGLRRRLGFAGLLLLAAGTLQVMLAAQVRSGVLALAAGGLLTLVALALRSRRSGLARVARPAGVALLVLAGLTLLIAASPLGPRLAPATLAISLQGRVEVWSVAAGIVLSHPLTGVGPDNFVAAYPSVRPEPVVLVLGNQLQSSTHDWLLYFATSAGIPGLIAMIVLLVLAARAWLFSSAQSAGAAVCGIAIGSYLAQGIVNVNDLALDWILWLALGILAGITGTDLAARRSRARSQSGLAAAAVTALGLAILLTTMTWPRLLASESFAASSRLVKTNQGLAAVQQARTAILLDGRRGQYWSALGAALFAAGTPSAAATAFEDAARVEPWQPLYWKNAAFMRATLGQNDVAIVAANRALSLDPYDADARDLLAKLYFNRANFAQAAVEGERAIRLLPRNESTYEAPVRAEMKLGNYDRAESLLRSALSLIESARLRLLLAQVLYETGRFAESKQQVEVVLVAEGANEEALQLKRLLERH